MADLASTCAAQAHSNQAPRWRDALLRFNLEPALYAHSSWLPPWAQTPLAVSAPPLRAALSRALLEQQGLQTVFDWTLNHPGARLFLLDAAALRELARPLGVAAHRARLRRIVLQPQIAMLRTVLGDALDALWLPVTELVPALPSAALDGLLRSRGVADTNLLRQQIEHDGLLQLLRLLDPAVAVQRGAAGRAALCLPREVAAHALPPLPDAQSQALACGIAEQLLPLFAPAHRWLFDDVPLAH